MHTISSNEQTNLHINIYNSLTNGDFDNEKDDELNFLESIKYKITKGNILLECLIFLKENNIPFTIIKGFIYNEKSYDTFDRCRISINDNDISVLNKIIGIIIVKIEDNLYELKLIKKES